VIVVGWAGQGGTERPPHILSSYGIDPAGPRRRVPRAPLRPRTGGRPPRRPGALTAVRVLLVSNLWPPYWIGGYELLAFWVADGLRERGHEVEVLTGRGEALAGRPGVRAELDLDIDAVCRMHANGNIVFPATLRAGLGRHVWSARNYAACRRAVGQFRPELVSFWNPSFVTFSPLAAARHAGVPSVAHLCDTAVNAFRNPRCPAFPRPLLPLARAAVDLALAHARPQRVVVPSRFSRDKLLRSGKAVPAARVEVLHGPVRPEITRAGTRARGAAPRGRLLFVGSLIPEKGLDLLLAAFREATSVTRAASPEAAVPLSLTIVGGGPRPYVEGLERAAQGLPVRLLGRQAVEGVIRAYEDHDVLVFPSIWEEPFAVVPLEGMAMGLTVIATASGGTPEAIVTEETGILVPPDAGALARAILRVHAEPALARSLAEAGCRRAREHHAFPVFMDRLCTLYRGVAGPQGRA
jgi:glycogen synthase